MLLFIDWSIRPTAIGSYPINASDPPPPARRYCPDASTKRACEPNFWCPQKSKSAWMASPGADQRGNSKPRPVLWPVVVVVVGLATLSAAVIEAEDQLNQKAEAMKTIRRVIQASGTVLNRSEVAAFHRKFDADHSGTIEGAELKELERWVKDHVGEDHVRWRQRPRS